MPSNYPNYAVKLFASRIRTKIININIFAQDIKISYHLCQYFKIILYLCTLLWKIKSQCIWITRTGRSQ